MNAFNYAAHFAKFQTWNPTNAEIAEWHRRRQIIAEQNGNTDAAAMHADQVAFFESLVPLGGYRKDRPKRTPKVVFDRLRVVC